MEQPREDGFDSCHVFGKAQDVQYAWWQSLEASMTQWSLSFSLVCVYGLIIIPADIVKKELPS